MVLRRGILIELQMHSVRLSPSLPSLTAMFLCVNRDLSHSLSINWSHFSSTEMALAHVCHVLWIPSGCSFSDFFYLFQAGNTWLKRPHFLLQFSRTRTPSSTADLRWFLFSLLYQMLLLFSSPPKLRCPLSVLPFDILSSLSRSYVSNRVNFDLCLFNDLNRLWLFSLDKCCAIYHSLSTGKTFCLLTCSMSQSYSSFYPKASTLLEVPSYFLFYQIKTLVITGMSYFFNISITNISYFLVQEGLSGLLSSLHFPIPCPSFFLLKTQ